MFVGNLPVDATEDSVTSLFGEYGTVRSIKLVFDVFSGKCKGFGYVEMEGHEARAAVAGLHGKLHGSKNLKVTIDSNKRKNGRGRR